MAVRTPVEAVEYVLAQVERFARGVRRWQYEPDVHFAEIHSAVLLLCEDGVFADSFRRQLSARSVSGSSDVTKLDVDDLPELLDLFFNSLIGFLETSRGEMPDGAATPPSPLDGR